MKDRNEYRDGYKKTKVGWIPQDWSINEFGDLFQRLRQPVDVEPDKKYREIGIRSHGKGIFHKDLVSGLHLGNKSVFWVQVPSLVFNIVFAWEQAVAITSEREHGMIASHRFPMYVSKKNIVNLNYVYQFFLSKKGKHLLGLASPGGAGRNKTLGQNELHRLLIPLPSMEEQNKIYETLSTCNEMIEQTRKLIEVKSLLRKGLIQQLFTRKRRLMGFNIPWKNFILADLALIIISNVDKKVESNEIFVNLCNYQDVYYNDMIVKNMDFMKATASESEIDKFSLKKHDVIITKDSEIADEIAIPCYVAEDVENTLCGYHLSIIRPNPNKLYGPFLSYLLMTDQVHHQFVRIANGVTRFGLTNGAIKKIQICIPSIDEQHRIAEVLFLADEELRTLKLKLENLEKQKRGLMQKFLTGEIRVKV